MYYAVTETSREGLCAIFERGKVSFSLRYMIVGLCRTVSLKPFKKVLMWCGTFLQ